MMGSQLSNNVINILQKFTVLALSSEEIDALRRGINAVDLTSLPANKFPDEFWHLQKATGNVATFITTLNRLVVEKYHLEVETYYSGNVKHFTEDLLVDPLDERFQTAGSRVDAANMIASRYFEEFMEAASFSFFEKLSDRCRSKPGLPIDYALSNQMQHQLVSSGITLYL